jgi:AcrR family transcriptional regulator
MSSSRPEPTPASRKRRETVNRLIEAANAVVSEKGFQRASLDEIAVRAGLTKGAIYSNFESKEHLFWAVLGSRRIAIPSEWSSARSMRENLRVNAEAFSAKLNESRAEAAFLAEFILYALSNEGARSRWEAWFGAAFSATTPELEDYLKREGMPPFRTFWTAMQSMAIGLYIAHALTPQLVTEQDVVKAMLSLAGPEKP